MDEPTHISEPLKDVIAAIPDEPVDDQADHDLEDRQAKAAWLVGRLTTLVEHGDANIAWPSGVPTFPEARDAGHTHTLGQLEEIERAIAAAERQVAAPFPDRDPTDPTAIYVAADDPRVADIHRRFEALPPDLKAACGNQVTAAGVRRFSMGAGTEQCVTTWHQALDTHEAQAAERATKVELAVAVLTDAGIGVDVLVATVGNYTVANAWQADRLDDLADCATAGVLTVDDDGRLWVDADQVLGNWGGSKRPLLAAAKTLATQWGVDKPSKADDALAHPLLAAALLLVDLDPNEAEPAPDPAATTAA